MILWSSCCRWCNTKWQVSWIYALSRLQKELLDLEEKYHKSMLNNAQLDSEKQTFRYQVDLYKDQLEDLKEQLVEITRLHKDKSRVSGGRMISDWLWWQVMTWGCFAGIGAQETWLHQSSRWKRLPRWTNQTPRWTHWCEFLFCSFTRAWNLLIIDSASAHILSVNQSVIIILIGLVISFHAAIWPGVHFQRQSWWHRW